jgi:hypothetical protein
VRHIVPLEIANIFLAKAQPAQIRATFGLVALLTLLLVSPDLDTRKREQAPIMGLQEALKIGNSEQLMVTGKSLRICLLAGCITNVKPARLVVTGVIV